MSRWRGGTGSIRYHQNAMPAVKNDACSSACAQAWSSASSYIAGHVPQPHQAHVAARAPTAGWASGPSRSSSGRRRRTAGRRKARLRPTSSRIGARSASSRCWTMCAREQALLAEAVDRRDEREQDHDQAGRERERAQRVVRGRVAAARRRVRGAGRAAATRRRRPRASPRRAPGRLSDHVYSTATGSSGTVMRRDCPSRACEPVRAVHGIVCAMPRRSSDRLVSLVVPPLCVACREPELGGGCAVRATCADALRAAARPGQCRAPRRPALDARMGAVLLRGRRAARRDGAEGARPRRRPPRFMAARDRGARARAGCSTRACSCRCPASRPATAGAASTRRTRSRARWRG